MVAYKLIIPLSLIRLSYSLCFLFREELPCLKNIPETWTASMVVGTASMRMGMCWFIFPSSFCAQNQMWLTLMAGARFYTGSTRSWWALSKMLSLWSSRACKEMGSCSMGKDNVETTSPLSSKKGVSPCISTWVSQALPILFLCRAMENCFLHKVTEIHTDASSVSESLQYKLNDIFLLSSWEKKITTF